MSKFRLLDIFKKTPPTRTEQKQKLVQEALSLAPPEKAIFAKLSERMGDVPYANEEVLKGLYILCEKLSIDDHYTAIVSDDASGRLISLIIKEVLNTQREKNGLPKLPLRFIAGGGRMKNDESIRAFIAKNRDILQEPLLVTEFMLSGSSIVRVVDLFKEFGLKPDVATLSLGMQKQNYSKLQGTRLIYAKDDSWLGDKMYGGGTPNSRGTYQFAGVFKERSTDKAHPVPLKPNVPMEDRKGIQKTIQQSRQDISVIGQVFSHLLDARKEKTS